MPPLRLQPMLWKMSMAQGEDFWQGWDVVMGEELEMVPPPPTVQLKEAGWWILWGPAVEPAEEGPPLSPPELGPMEVDDTEQALEDGATVEEATDKETDSSLQLS